eukprot:1175821-Prorocentrum_minimum.AAC.2
MTKHSCMTKALRASSMPVEHLPESYVVEASSPPRNGQVLVGSTFLARTVSKPMDVTRLVTLLKPWLHARLVASSRSAV